MVRRFLNKAEYWAQKVQLDRIARKNNFSIEETLVITGSPRSGTTWLAESILKDNSIGLVWEPLYLSQDKELERMGLGWRPFIPEGTKASPYYEFFQNLFSGKYLKPNHLHIGAPRSLKESKRLLIKFCRANLLLPWLTDRFPLTPPIHIVRHPCAVIASQLRYGAWNNIPETVEKPDVVYSDIYDGYTEIMKTVKSKEERLAFFWALENGFLLGHPRKEKDWITVFYEDLVMDKKKVKDQIQNTWKIDVPSFDSRSSNMPSSTTQKGSPLLEKGEQDLSSWKEVLNEEQIQKILSITKKMGVTEYGENIVPVK